MENTSSKAKHPGASTQGAASSDVHPLELYDLPNEILTHILGYVDSESAYAVKGVSKRARNVMKENLRVTQTRTSEKWILSSIDNFNDAIGENSKSGAGNYTPTLKTLESACRLGKVEIVKKLIEKFKLIPNRKCVIVAAERGDVKLLDLFKKHYASFEKPDVIIAAMYQGDIDTLNWLYETCDVKGFGSDLKQGFLYAVKNNKTAAIQWLATHSLLIGALPFAKDAANDYIAFIKSTSLEIMDILYNAGVNIPLKYMFNTARNFGRTDIIKWIEIHTSDRWVASSLDHFLYATRAQSGMRYIPTSKTLEYASELGTLDVFKEVVEDWDKDITPECAVIAAAHGNVNILDYIQSKGHPIDYPGMITQAIADGRVNVMEWLLQHYQLRTSDAPAYLKGKALAIQKNQRFMLEWIEDEGLDIYFAAFT